MKHLDELILLLLGKGRHRRSLKPVDNHPKLMGDVLDQKVAGAGEIHGGFAYLPSKVSHAFPNLSHEPSEIIVVYTYGGGHKFCEEFGPISRSGPPDPKRLAPVFEKYEMSLLGPPLSFDD